MKNHQEREFSIYMAFSAYSSKKKNYMVKFKMNLDHIKC